MNGTRPDSACSGASATVSMRRALEAGCEFYFVADVDNFVRPCTLRELVALDLPIVAPLLRSIAPGAIYSNYHAEIDPNGYYRDCDQYMWILNRWIRGVVEVPVVHTTYLVRADAIPELTYQDETSRPEYVVFSDSARRAGVPQYLDNRQIYGYIDFAADSDRHFKGAVEAVRAQLAAEITTSASPQTPQRVFSCFGLHSSGSTWMFNLVREICKAASIPFVSVHRDSKANLPWDSVGAPLIVAKSHNPLDDFLSFVAETDAPAVVTVRDPRDALVSFRERFGNSLGAGF